MLRDRANRQLCLPGTRFEDVLLRRIRQIEEPLLGKPFVEALECRITREIASRIKL